VGSSFRVLEFGLQDVWGCSFRVLGVVWGKRDVVVSVVSTMT